MRRNFFKETLIKKKNNKKTRQGMSNNTKYGSKISLKRYKKRRNN